MTARNFILATAGHVDHGKTALIKALTGTDTDRLPEEKKRGITIDLGFAHLALPGFSVGVIDVPGHEDFVRNMIAGVGSIDLALLVVAADDGWMPQTEEHLQILSYLGVTRLVVALTKSDLGRTEGRRVEIRAQLEGTPFAEAPVVETSIREALGLATLQEALAGELEKLPRRRDHGKPRLFVDRVFTVRGSGTVVTGTLSGGQFRRGATVRVLPQGLETRLRALQSHHEALEVAVPGTRTALNLADVSAEQITRGAVVTLPDAGSPSLVLDVVLERSQRLPSSTRPLKSGAILNLHHGSGRLGARVQLRDRKQLLPNERSIARLFLRTPVLAFAGDRFIVRDSSEQTTMAGGLVLDAEAEGVKFRSSAQRLLLDARAAAPHDCQTFLRTELQRNHFAVRAQLLRKSPFSQDEISAGLTTLHSAGQIFLDEKIAADASWWRTLRETAAKLVQAKHAEHPEQTGLEIGHLRAALDRASDDVFTALLRDLSQHGFVQKGGFLQQASHQPSLPPALRAAGDRIRAALRARPFDPPARKELATGVGAPQALRFLCERDEVIILSDEVVIGADAFARLRGTIGQHLQAGKSGTVSELRQATGTTRRIIVPLLERLDRLGLTIREGDRRRLR